jgi:malate dehydrogenase (quinone)
MIQVLEKTLQELINSRKGKQLLKEIVPIYKTEVTKELFDEH